MQAALVLAMVLMATAGSHVAQGGGNGGSSMDPSGSASSTTGGKGAPGAHTYGGATGPGSASVRARGGGGPVTGGPRDVAAALDTVERAATLARDAVRGGQWDVARAHVTHLEDWLALATRMQRPSGEAAVRWDFAAREAKRLNTALGMHDAGQARWADAALTLAIADARASLGGGAGGEVPAATPTPTPRQRRLDPELKYEDIPLDRERPWSRGRM